MRNQGHSIPYKLNASLCVYNVIRMNILLTLILLQLSSLPEVLSSMLCLLSSMQTA